MMYLHIVRPRLLLTLPALVWLGAAARPPGAAPAGAAPAPRPPATPAPAAAPAPAQPFFLRSGDRVVFYGDSITDARLYTAYVETFVLTRFPALDVRFVHSGWGGDRVDGGTGGRVDLRIQRDILAHKPTVVTVMLGMNDGRYKGFDQEVLDAYVTGYERLIRSLKTALPQARLTVMQPSPYDEVTRPPLPEGGYSQVLSRFGAFVKKLAAREHLQLADLNSDLVQVLARARARDPEAAARIIPDRRHPVPAGHLILAGSLLEAWHAPALVTSVELDAARGQLVQARNASVSEVERAGGGLRWSELDGALPMPLDGSDPLVELVLSCSSFVQRLNQQPLKVTGLGEGPYALRIDDKQVGVFRGPVLARGINLAILPTPMARQATEVHNLTYKHNDIHFTRWRYVQLRLDRDAMERSAAALDALDGVERELIDRQRAMARPRLRRFALVPASPVAANVPAGFTPVVGGDLRRVLLGGERHRDLEVYLEMDGSDADAAANLLLRLEDDGEAYRVSLDAREGGALGRVDSVGFRGWKPSAVPPWRDHWKKGEWNALRVRIDGEAAHVTVWLNGIQITDWTDWSGHPPNPATDGWAFAAVELPPAGATDAGPPPRFRNVSVRPLR